MWRYATHTHTCKIPIYVATVASVFASELMSWDQIVSQPPQPTETPPLKSEPSPERQFAAGYPHDALSRLASMQCLTAPYGASPPTTTNTFCASDPNAAFASSPQTNIAATLVKIRAKNCLSPEKPIPCTDSVKGVGDIGKVLRVLHARERRCARGVQLGEVLDAAVHVIVVDLGACVRRTRRQMHVGEQKWGRSRQAGCPTARAGLYRRHMVRAPCASLFGRLGSSMGPPSLVIRCLSCHTSLETQAGRLS